jgi:hypothetical protein
MPTASPSRGEIVTLKEHFESRLQAVEKGIEVAYAGMQSRLATMNEFRETLRDQSAKFITREELEAKLSAICGQVKSLEISKAILEGKASQSQVTIALLLSVIGLGIAVVSLIVNIIP